MNYLVTGAAGFIAAKVCEFLLAAGHRVVGIDNLNDYYDPRLKLHRLGRLAATAGAPEAAAIKARAAGPRESAVPADDPPSVRSQRFVFHALDIEDMPELEKLFARESFDAVFNLAARAGVRYSLENPRVYLTTNVLGTLNVLECQRRHGVKKQVLASTSSLYAGRPMPFTEDQPVDTPLSPYAAAKRAAELLACTYHKIHGLDITVLRYFTVFGPAGRPDMSPFRFIKWIDEGAPIKLFGDGTQARDFTYVDDIARGTILAAKPFGFEIINLGGGRNPISLHAMIALLEKTLGKKARIDGHPSHPADVKETWADITKADRLLGWRPEIAPEEGFRRTVEWHATNRDWIRDMKV